MRSPLLVSLGLATLTGVGWLVWRWTTPRRPADTAALYANCYGARPALPRATNPAGTLLDAAGEVLERGVRRATEAVASNPTPDDERRAGELAALALGRWRRLDNGVEVDRVQRIATRLVAALPEQRRGEARFLVLDTLDRNAFMAPGPLGYVLRGLVAALDDDALAFVLAHELAHSELGHADDLVRASAAGRRLAQHEGLDGATGAALGVALARAPAVFYDQRQEYAADQPSASFRALDSSAGVRTQ